MSNSDKLLKYIKSVNIAEDLDDELLGKIGMAVVRDFDIDWNSCAEWREQNRRALDLAKQTKEAKNFPWPGAANVKYPLVTVGAIQFAARAYPEIVQGTNIVKTRIVGQDTTGEKAARAIRVSEFMSWQFSEEIGSWDEDTDRLLHILPVIGCLFRKTCWNSIERRNDSVLLLPDECVVHYKTKNLKTCRRISHLLKYYENDVYERISAKTWLDIDLGDPPRTDDDSDTTHDFIEQHRYWDLDDDGYAEPYIVTVHKGTSKVVRIVARFDAEGVEMDAKSNNIIRIAPHQYFVKFSFIPNPDGSFLDIGWGTLLEPINESINTALNELLDAGAMHNAGGGFIGRGINMKGGKLTFSLGEWKTTENTGQALRDNLFPLPTREPSQVLFALLGFLVEAGKDIANIRDALMGEKPGENVSNDLFVSMINQGLKVYNGIFKRIYRSLTQEFKLHYWLNSQYLDPEKYYMVSDNKKIALQKDFQYKDCDVYPVSDPNLSLDIQRIGMAQILINGMQFPGMLPMGIVKRWLEANRIQNIEEVFDPNQKPQPNPQVEQIYLQMGLARDKHNLEKQEIFANILKTLAQTKETYAKAVKAIADAEAVEPGMQLDQYKAQVQEMGVMVKAQEAEFKRMMDNEQPAQGQQQIPGRAEGGPVSDDEPYVVGEKGPEIFIPKKDGVIIPNNYGLRPDGTPKGEGWLGPLKRPGGGVSSELSVDFDFDGKKVYLPLLVPTLNQQEIDYLLNGGNPTPDIKKKAIDHYLKMKSEGKGPFK